MQIMFIPLQVTYPFQAFYFIPLEITSMDSIFVEFDGYIHLLHNNIKNIHHLHVDLTSN